MSKLRAFNSRKGSVLMTGVMVMMMVSMFGLAYVTLTSTNLLRAGRDERRSTAFYLAEAGLEYVIADVTERAETNGGKVTQRTYTSEITTLFSNLRPGAGATGSVTVTPDATLDTYGTIVSAATYRGITESIRVRVKIRGVGVWDNAIFAGIGQSGRGINGNVDIRGSVHILGDGEPFNDLNGNLQWDDAETYTDQNGNGLYDSGEPFVDTDGNTVWSDAELFQDNNLNGQYDPPLTATDLATDLGGSAYIGNNYNGIPETLRTKIPALVPESWGGESIYTLNAELRVKHGKVNLSGTASAGLPNLSGNLVKETLDGTYVTDGYGGNQGTNNVYSDNGTSNGYDLGDKVPFPSLLEPYTDPDTHISYATYAAYLDANSFEVPADVTTIDDTIPDFTYGDGTNSISWDQSEEVLTITGIVRFPGDLDLSKKSDIIYYSGKGTLYVKNDIRVHGSVMPTGTFPTQTAIGVIAARDINFATGPGEAQLYSAGAWYAQRTIVSAKQNKFGGTYVANYFDMGTNVPNIYQIPELARNLPPGMPGGDVRIVVTQVLSWRHL
jgi:Tfp pilus assembly protein PilX